MAQSETSQVLEPLEEAEEVITMKIEIMRIVKQHEILMRKETSRASSRSSLGSRMSAVLSTFRKKSAKIHWKQAFWQPKQHTPFFEGHCWILRRNENPNQRNWNNNNNYWQVQSAEQEHTKVGRMHGKRSSFWPTSSSPNSERHFTRIWIW